MSYRYMRIILFFDLPTITSSEQKAYRTFVKEIKKLGFYMIQESVYVKMSLDMQKAESIVEKVRSFIPTKGNIMTVTMTEKQFSSMKILLGENKTDVIDTDSRMVFL